MAIRLFKDEADRTDLIRLFAPDDFPIDKPPQAPGKSIERFPQTLEQLEDLQLDPFSLDANIKNVIPTFFESFKESIAAAGDSLGTTLGFKGKQTKAEKIGSVLETTAKITGALLAPITSLFAAAEEVPVLGTVAKLIALPFSIAGESASIIAGAALDKVPDSVLSQESKDAIKPGLQEISSLASQLAVGKGGQIVVKRAKVNELVKKYGKKDAQTIVTKATEIASKEQGAVEGTPKGIKLFGEEAVQRSQRPIGTGETRTSKLARGVEERAIESRLVETLGDLPEFQRVSMKDQANRAKKFIDENPEGARRVALGREIPPADILPESIFVALERKATLEGDIFTIKSLATESGLSLEATAMGQRIRTLAERSPDSPVAAITEVAKARASKTKDVVQAKNKVKSEIKFEMKKTKIKKETWNSFVDSLIC